MDYYNKCKTGYCIICGERFTNNVIPSKEHIIPQALGNNKIITYNVCSRCNNDLGRNVDSYFTDYPIIKLVRKNTLAKDKDIKIITGKMKDDSGESFLITDNGPEIIPSVSILGTED